MIMQSATTLDLPWLRHTFGKRLQENVPLARLTSARVGGKADLFITAESADDLANIVDHLWNSNTPFLIMGGGSNMLVGDAGVRAVVVFNRARKVRFDVAGVPASVWAESGANFGLIARQAAKRGLSGLEWAAGIPGTVGGAVVGNAGAHKGELSGNLLVAEILHQEKSDALRATQSGEREAGHRREYWSVERFGYRYRTSILKKIPGRHVVLSASLRLEHSSPEKVKAKIEEFVSYRRHTQPPGASMGSMFKNPAGDYAGRLIEAAGLKGKKIGRAEISPLHANFFINHGGATAEDIWKLIQLTRDAVEKKFGIVLELEIEPVGEW
ncbi:MAG TPA: UDP-N-acetylmuramate dehydrogenase [Anaerolineales bacterium]